MKMTINLFIVPRMGSSSPDREYEYDLFLIVSSVVMETIKPSQQGVLSHLNRLNVNCFSFLWHDPAPSYFIEYVMYDASRHFLADY